MTANLAEDHQQLPVLLGLREMVDLFPVARTTVYRWNTARGGSGPSLPKPDRVVSGTPMWREETVLAFAADRGLEPDPAVIARIRAAQRG